MKKRISVIFSFFNEEEILPDLLKRLNGVFSRLGFDYEWIFVNDASTDRSLEVLKTEAKTNPHIKILNMSRNFGVYPCFLAGIRHARGDAVITMDTDLQDPPEVIPQLVGKWLEGFDVVYAVRSKRHGEPFWKMTLTKLGYRLLKLFSEGRIPVDAGDFRLLSRHVVDALMKLPEYNPYLKGLVPWLGFQRDFVRYEREPRSAGKTHMPLFSGLKPTYPVKLFISGITSFSVLPLYFAFFLGLLSMGGALLYFLFYPAAAVFYFFILFFAGVQLVCIGLLGFYLGRVYLELKGRPNYIIESRIGFED